MRRSMMVLVGVFIAWLLLGLAPAWAGAPPPPDQYVSLPRPGEKIPLTAEYSFVYGFQKPPKRGTAILKIRVFTAAGQPDTSLTVHAQADMPSMRGAHASGYRELALSKQGEYIFPAELVMSGQWEIRLIFLKHGKVIFRGSHTFTI
jgi:hypothetical protein